MSAKSSMSAKRPSPEKEEKEDEASKRVRGPGDDDDENDWMIGEEEAAALEEAAAMAEAMHDMEAQASDAPSNVDDQLHKLWQRPALSKPFNGADEIVFQWTAIDMYTGEPLRRHPVEGSRMPGADTGPVPIVRLYGVTPEGNSVLSHVYGFTPYCYCSAPVEFDEGKHTSTLAQMLDTQLKAAATGEGKRCAACVLGIETERDKHSLMGYQCEGTQAAFFKVYLALPTLVPTLKRILEGGIVIPGCGGGQQIPCQTFESNVPFLLRFMIDKEISGMNWLTLPARHYARRPSAACKSTCQLEFDCVFDSIVSHKAEGEWNRIAPLRVLSVDIECCGRKGHFPEAEQDPVIQISNVVNVQGEKQAFTQNVFTLGGCLPIVGAHVITSTTEHEMLQRWAEFVRVADPDIITGYNTQNFDVPYLLNRGKALAKVKGRVGPSFDRFFHWGRMRGTPARMRDSTFSSAQYGKRENIETTVDGRVMFDLLPYMFRNHKLSSYSLNSVCAEFLGQQKEDVHHSIIADLQNGSDADRRRLAVYCLKDSQLVGLLLDKLSVLVNYIEMARVTGVPVDFLLSRGQQIKVFSMLLRKCRREKLLIPNIAKHVRGGEEDGVGYEGATVIEPKRAFYQDPIATLDFASLYPSIMQAYNLCYSTLIAGSAVQALVGAGKLGPDDFAVAPTDGKDTFVKATTRKGILPQILDELLAARKRAKKDMKAATDPMEYAVQNGRQLALKVSANSVYGFTGATVGQLPCLPIASSVTAYGRELLLKTKQHVEDNYEGSEVVYGDTDSVMIRFGLSTVEETMPLAEKVADEVSAIFPRPVQLEFEKVYCPFLLMNKKRYAGLLWTNPEKYDKLDAKGLETVRRDNCLLVRQLIDRCLRTMLINKDVEAAIAYAKNSIADLVQNKLDISLLVITKSLSKSADSEEYKSTMPHVELAKKLAKRDPLTAPAVGDRVPYVIIQGAKGASASERAEDPVYVLDNNVPIDTKYYLENQLKKPLERIFEPIIENCSTLFVGEHTRTICKPTPTARKGGIMSFAVKKSKCLGCKALIDDGDGHLCAHCRPRESEIYLAKLALVHEHENTFSRLWTQCQACQGSFHQDVLCTNSDCPIFYKRKKVQKDLNDTMATLDRFSW